MAVRNFLSFLSLLGSRRPPLPAHKRSASQASHAAARGLFVGNLVRPNQAERGVRVSPPPRPPLALPAAPHAQPAPRPWASDRDRGAMPRVSPSSPAGLLGRLAFAVLTPVFRIDRAVVVCLVLPL